MSHPPAWSTDKDAHDAFRRVRDVEGLSTIDELFALANCGKSLPPHAVLEIERSFLLGFALAKGTLSLPVVK
jgi:hypothetical protein